MTTVNEQLARVPTEHDVKCTECGHVGKAFLPTTGDFNPEVKAWGENLVALSAAVTLDEVLEELKKPATIEGCNKGLALARDRVRCLRNPAAGVPDTAFAAPAGEELFVEFTDIIKARSPEAWQLLHVGTVAELVRVALDRLTP